MYTQDYDETFPMVMDTSRAFTPNRTNPSVPGEKYTVADPGEAYVGNYFSWMDGLYPYIKNIQVFDCPSRAQPWIRPSDSAKLYWPHLGYNGLISGGWNDADPATPGLQPGRAMKLAGINGASQKILLGHNRIAAYLGLSPADHWAWSQYESEPNSTNRDRAAAAFPHLDGQNYMFCDGHAKFAPRSKTAYWTCNGSGGVYDSDTLTTGCGFWMPLVAPPA